MESWRSNQVISILIVNLTLKKKWRSNDYFSSYRVNNNCIRRATGHEGDDKTRRVECLLKLWMRTDKAPLDSQTPKTYGFILYVDNSFKTPWSVESWKSNQVISILMPWVTSHQKMIWNRLLPKGYIRSLADIAEHICQIKRRCDGNFFLKPANEHFFVSGRIN